MVESQSLLQEGKILLGRSVAPEYLELKLANRHGLVTGATGTGKTVTLQVLAEGFSNAGVPVFAADIKGDLSGISATGENSQGLAKRAKEIGLDDWTNAAFPTLFWDLFGEQGHPIRATVQDMGPLLLARLMELNETQEGVLKRDLFLMRDAIDQYYADKNKYPASLDALVSDQYLRKIPEDPITQSTDTWQTVPAEPDPANPTAEPGIYDVKSGAQGQGLDGSNYQDW